MIDLTRLNGQKIAVNCDLIRYAEASPDTTLTLVTGEKLIVREGVEEVVERTHQYRISMLRGAWPEAGAAIAARTTYDAHRSHHQSPHVSGIHKHA